MFRIEYVILYDNDQQARSYSGVQRVLYSKATVLSNSENLQFLSANRINFLYSRSQGSSH